MIKIVITNVNKAIEQKKGPLAALGARLGQRIGLVDTVRLAEEKIAQKIKETLDAEGVSAEVTIDPENKCVE